MKRIVLINIVWALVAAGTFFAGARWQLAARREASTGTDAVRTVAAPAAPNLPAKSTDPAKSVSAALVSRDDSVIDFLRRYNIGNGQPLPPELMKQAISEALRETDPVKSQLLFSRLMQELTPENAPVALAMLRENVGGFDAGRYMGLLAYAWGSVDPQAAMTEFTRNTNDRFGGRFGQPTVLSGWAATDPAGAIAWLNKYEGEGKEWLSQALVTGLAKSDVDAAIKFAGELKDEDERARSAESIAREMIRTKGIDQASAWIGSLTDANMKRGAFDAVAQQFMRTDPAKAADFVKQFAGEEFARGAIGNVAETFAREDPKKGIEFASKLSGPAQSRAYGEVIGEWLNRDRGSESMQASQFVSQLPPGPNRDAGAEAIARSILRDDPNAAIAWAGSIQNPAERQETLVEVGRRYMRMDPQAAATWLVQSGLSPEVQQQVLAREEDRGEWRDRIRGAPGGAPGGGGDRGPRDFGGGRRGGRER